MAALAVLALRLRRLAPLEVTLGSCWISSLAYEVLATLLVRELADLADLAESADAAWGMVSSAMGVEGEALRLSSAVSSTPLLLSVAVVSTVS